MNLKQTYVHARLYKFFYSVDKLPQNLCSYFWKLVVAFIFVIPYTIISLPILVIDYMSEDKSNFGIRAGGGIVIWACATLTCIVFYGNYHLVRYWLNCYSYDNDWASVGGFYDVIILIGFSIVFARRIYFKLKLIEPKQYIVTEFIKAKYNKYCPKITWK